MSSPVQPDSGVGPLEDIATAHVKARCLDFLVPRVGSIWHWEPMSSTATQRVKVVETKWNGEEWWIASVPSNVLGWHDDRVAWNDLDRWVEAAVLVTPAPGDE